MSMYDLTFDLANAIADDEFARVRNIMAKWPKNMYIEMLGVVGVLMSTKEIETTEEISKALMLFSCQRSDMDDVWNFAMNEKVSIHYENYTPFFAACKANNISMIRDFRRFQYDEKDGSNIIPFNVWQRGLKVAKKNSAKEVAHWIQNYIWDGTDDEDDDDLDSVHSRCSNSECQQDVTGHCDCVSEYSDCSESEDEDREHVAEIRKHVAEIRKQIKEAREAAKNAGEITKPDNRDE